MYIVYVISKCYMFSSEPVRVTRDRAEAERVCKLLNKHVYALAQLEHKNPNHHYDYTSV